MLLKAAETGYVIPPTHGTCANHKDQGTPRSSYAQTLMTDLATVSKSNYQRLTTVHGPEIISGGWSST